MLQRLPECIVQCIDGSVAIGGGMHFLPFRCCDFYGSFGAHRVIAEFLDDDAIAEEFKEGCVPVKYLPREEFKRCFRCFILIPVAFCRLNPLEKFQDLG